MKEESEDKGFNVRVKKSFWFLLMTFKKKKLVVRKGNDILREFNKNNKLNQNFF